jgi:hypothetical protein
VHKFGKFNLFSIFPNAFLLMLSFIATSVRTIATAKVPASFANWRHILVKESLGCGLINPASGVESMTPVPLG